MPSPIRLLPALAALALAAPAAARAQVPEDTARADTLPAPRADSASVAAEGMGECRRGVISRVFVDNNSVFDVSDPGLDRRFTWAYRLANRMHFATREGVIRRELLFREGDCYQPYLLEDSERILRSVPFIADADVFAIRQPDGTQHVVVQTRDEWSTRLEPQWESGGEWALTGLELREDNFLGRGQRISAFVKEFQGERIYGAMVGTRQLLRTRWDGELGVAKTPVGLSISQRLSYPFRGEGGRWAFRQQFSRAEQNFEFWVEEPTGLRRRFFPEERTSFDLGGVFRVGRRGSLTMFGLALSGDWIVYPQDSLAPISDPDRVAPGDLPNNGAVVGLDSVSSVRLVLMIGQRNVRFDRRRALDAVRGAEDVRLGFEAEVGLGRSLAALSDDDDLSVQLGLSAAGDLGPVLAGARVVGEVRRDFGAPSGGYEWRNLFGQLDAWAYWRPGDESRHTWVAALQADGGWRTTVPFQLTLGSRAGLRGYGRHVYAGERRLVGTLEHRAYLGWPYPQLLDVGSALFVDAGKIWPGGDAFGLESPWQVGAGAGLRIAFPPGSRQTYRLDVSFPVSPDFRPGTLQFSFGVGQAVGRKPASDDESQIRRSSRRALTTSLFSFPN